MNIEEATKFVKALISRGLGIYGPEKMKAICIASDIELNDNYEFEWQSEDIDRSVKKLQINYAKVNLPARMTVTVLAKKHGIPVPEEVRGPRIRQSKFKQSFDI
ncbi:MAG: hypothetical protein ACW98K_12510 [Candidatus Kariarchaeaceae archaeon]|jgi:hypothetical protein